MNKTFLIFIIGLVVLIAIIVIVVGFYLGPIVKLGLEQVGPKVTQVSIKVDSVDVSLLSGSATIKGLNVGNPSGYSSPEAISVGNITVSLDAMSVTSQKILIHSVNVQSPDITFEAGLGGDNLNKILSNVNSFAKSTSPSSGNTAGSNNNPAPKIEVDDFLITGAKVHVAISGLGGRDIPLPDIHLTDLGKGNDGLTPVELTGQVLMAITKDTATAVAGSIGNIGTSLNKITGSLGSLFGK